MSVIYSTDICMPDWVVKACEPCEEVSQLDEFCRIRKSEEITLETYHSMRKCDSNHCYTGNTFMKNPLCI